MAAEESSADYSLRILWSLARWVEDTHGRDALEKIASKAKVSASEFDGSTRWVSHEQLETILSAAHDLAGNDETFRNALGYRFEESYGALRYMAWALSPQKICETAASLSKLVTTVGSFEVLESKPTGFRVRYRTTRPESRLVCESRKVAWSRGPTMWGLPPAQLDETSCVASGADYCEYHLKWLSPSRGLPVVLAVVGGGAASIVVGVLTGWSLTLALVPVLAGVVAQLIEQRRASTANLNYAIELNSVLRSLGEEEAANRAEIFALHQRQREWIALMEQQVTERTRTLEKIVSGIDDIQQSRVSTLRGFSHDLRNPLFVVRGNAQFLLDKFTTGEEGEALRDMDQAAGQIEAMLARLMEVATQDTGFVKLSPKPIAVPPLADTFRRRLKALVHGRDIKVSVFCTREAPEEIVVDPVVFDRVVDNVLTNAAKYTQRGSIVLELSGAPRSGNAPGCLTLKLSDTGQGIAPERVEKIFRPRPADEPSSTQSYGIGLSSVVRLLAQIGGRIDVMSKLGVGTTFWAHFPVEPAAKQTKPPKGEDNLESMIMRVVTIRKAEGT